MSKLRLPAAIALVVGFLTVQTALCTTLEDTFSITVDSGPWSSATPYTGSFTWDPANWNTTNSALGGLSSFTSTLPIPVAGNQLSVDWAMKPTNPGGGYAPWDITLTVDPSSLPPGSVNYFILQEIGPGSGEMVYGVAGGSKWTSASATFVDPTVGSHAPEPGTLWLTVIGILGILGVMRRRGTAKSVALAVDL
jgi:hypothetical protein